MKLKWLRVLKPISQRARLVFGCLSFVLPIIVWSVVSYVPFVWHPQVQITDPGSVDYLEAGMRMDKDTFENEVADAHQENRAPPEGFAANPVYLPAPHEVAIALYTSFTTPPVSQDGQWLHQSLWHSIQIIFWGFVISSIIGVPLGILCGTYSVLSRPRRAFHRILPLSAGARLWRARGGDSWHL